MIRDALEADREWVGEIFRASDHILGKGFFGTIWYRYWQTVNKRERWVVIEGKAFAHYKERLDGIKVLYEIAVRAEERRRGYGSKLLAFIGAPMELKTDSEHGESNAFYRAMGFYPCGLKTSRDGKKKLRIYRCAQ